MAAIIDRLPGRLGDDEATLRESLAQLRLAFVMLQDRRCRPRPTVGLMRAQRTILDSGNSRMSLAPASLSAGINTLI